MGPNTKADRACAVAAAAAHEFNHELTVIMSAAAIALATVDRESPARILLLDIQAAAERSAKKVAALLNFAWRVPKRGRSNVPTTSQKTSAPVLAVRRGR